MQFLTLNLSIICKTPRFRPAIPAWWWERRAIRAWPA